MLLFLGEMLTATAMGWFEDQIARAVVLALFVPLIISSGGNAGSQATTLVIRAMALGELTTRDVLTVIRRELSTGLALGVLLAAIGCTRILLWQQLFGSYGEHALAIAATVSLSLVGVVLWGTVAGSVLPFVLRAVAAGSRQRFRAVRRDVRRRDGTDHLLHGRRRHSSRHVAVILTVNREVGHSEIQS